MNNIDNFLSEINKDIKNKFNIQLGGADGKNDEECKNELIQGAEEESKNILIEKCKNESVKPAGESVKPADESGKDTGDILQQLKEGKAEEAIRSSFELAQKETNASGEALGELSKTATNTLKKVGEEVSDMVENIGNLKEDVLNGSSFFKKTDSRLEQIFYPFSDIGGINEDKINEDKINDNPSIKFVDRNGKPLEIFNYQQGGSGTVPNYYINGIETLESLIALIRAGKNEWEKYSDSIFEKINDDNFQKLTGLLQVTLTNKTITKEQINNHLINGFFDPEKSKELSEESSIKDKDYIISLIDVTGREFSPNDNIRSKNIDSIKLYRFSKEELTDPIGIMKVINGFKNKFTNNSLNNSDLIQNSYNFKSNICVSDTSYRSCDFFLNKFIVNNFDNKINSIPLKDQQHSLINNVSRLDTDLNISKILYKEFKDDLKDDSVFNILDKTKNYESVEETTVADLKNDNWMNKLNQSGGSWTFLTGGAKKINKLNYVFCLNNSTLILNTENYKKFLEKNTSYNYKLVYGFNNTEWILLYGSLYSDNGGFSKKQSFFIPKKEIDGNLIDFMVKPKFDTISVETIPENIDRKSINKDKKLLFYGYDNKKAICIDDEDILYNINLENLELDYLSKEEIRKREVERANKQLQLLQDELNKKNEELLKKEDELLKKEDELMNKQDGDSETQSKNEDKSIDSDRLKALKALKTENKEKEKQLRELKDKMEKEIRKKQEEMDNEIRICKKENEKLAAEKANIEQAKGCPEPIPCDVQGADDSDKTILEMFNQDPSSLKKVRNLVYSLIQITKVFAPYNRVIYDEDFDCDMDDMFTKYMNGIRLSNIGGNFTKGSLFRWGLVSGLYLPKTANTSGISAWGGNTWDDGKLQSFGFSKSMGAVGNNNNGEIYPISILNRKEGTKGVIFNRSIGAIEHIIDAARLNIAYGGKDNSRFGQNLKGQRGGGDDKEITSDFVFNINGYSDGVELEQSGGRGMRYSEFDFGSKNRVFSNKDVSGIIKWTNEAYYTEYRQSGLIKMLRQKLIEIFIVLSLSLALNVKEYENKVLDYGFKDGRNGIDGNKYDVGESPYDTLKGFFPENKKTYSYYRILSDFIDEEKTEKKDFKKTKSATGTLYGNKNSERIHFFFKQIRKNKFLRCKDQGKLRFLKKLSDNLQRGEDIKNKMGLSPNPDDIENLSEEDRCNYILATLNINNFHEDISDMLKNTNIYDETGYMRDSRTKSGYGTKDLLEMDFRNFIDTYVKLQYNVKPNIVRDRVDYFMDINANSPDDFNLFIDMIKKIGQAKSSSELKKLKIREVDKIEVKNEPLITDVKAKNQNKYRTILTICDRIKQMEKDYKLVGEKSSNSQVLREYKDRYRVKLFRDPECNQESLLQFTDIHGEGKVLKYCDDLQEVDSNQAQRMDKNKQLSKYGDATKAYVDGKLVEINAKKKFKDKSNISSMAMLTTLRHIFQKYYEKRHTHFTSSAGKNKDGEIINVSKEELGKLILDYSDNKVIVRVNTTHFNNGDIITKINDKDIIEEEIDNSNHFKINDGGKFKLVGDNKILVGDNKILVEKYKRVFYDILEPNEIKMIKDGEIDIFEYSITTNKITQMANNNLNEINGEQQYSINTINVIKDLKNGTYHIPPERLTPLDYINNTKIKIKKMKSNTKIGDKKTDGDGYYIFKANEMGDDTFIPGKIGDFVGKNRKVIESIEKYKKTCLFIQQDDPERFYNTEWGYTNDEHKDLFDHESIGYYKLKKKLIDINDILDKPNRGILNKIIDYHNNNDKKDYQIDMNGNIYTDSGHKIWDIVKKENTITGEQLTEAFINIKIRSDINSKKKDEQLCNLENNDLIKYATVSDYNKDIICSKDFKNVTKTNFKNNMKYYIKGGNFILNNEIAYHFVYSYLVKKKIKIEKCDFLKKITNINLETPQMRKGEVDKNIEFENLIFSINNIETEETDKYTTTTTLNLRLDQQYYKDLHAENKSNKEYYKILLENYNIIKNISVRIQTKIGSYKGKETEEFNIEGRRHTFEVMYPKIIDNENTQCYLFSNENRFYFNNLYKTNFKKAAVNKNSTGFYGVSDIQKKSKNVKKITFYYYSPLSAQLQKEKLKNAEEEKEQNGEQKQNGEQDGEQKQDGENRQSGGMRDILSNIDTINILEKELTMDDMEQDGGANDPNLQECNYKKFNLMDGNDREELFAKLKKHRDLNLEETNNYRFKDIICITNEKGSFYFKNIMPVMRDNSILNYYPITDTYNRERPFGDEYFNLKTKGKNLDIASLKDAQNVKNHYRALLSLFTEVLYPDKSEFGPMQLFSLTKKELCFDTHILKKYKMLQTGANKWNFVVNDMSSLELMYPNFSRRLLEEKRVELGRTNMGRHYKVLVAEKDFRMKNRVKPVLLLQAVDMSCEPSVINKIMLRKLYIYINDYSIEQELATKPIKESKKKYLEMDDKKMKLEIISDTELDAIMDQIKEMDNNIYNILFKIENDRKYINYDLHNDKFTDKEGERFVLDDNEGEINKLIEKFFDNCMLKINVLELNRGEKKEINLCFQNRPYDHNENVRFRYPVDPNNIIYNQMAYQPYVLNTNAALTKYRLPQIPVNDHTQFNELLDKPNNKSIAESVMSKVVKKANVEKDKLDTLPNCIADRINSLPIYKKDNILLNVYKLDINDLPPPKPLNCPEPKAVDVKPEPKSVDVKPEYKKVDDDLDYGDSDIYNEEQLKDDKEPNILSTVDNGAKFLSNTVEGIFNQAEPTKVEQAEPTKVEQVEQVEPEKTKTDQSDKKPLSEEECKQKLKTGAEDEDCKQLLEEKDKVESDINKVGGSGKMINDINNITTEKIADIISDTTNTISKISSKRGGSKRQKKITFKKTSNRMSPKSRSTSKTRSRSKISSQIRRKNSNRQKRNYK